MFPCLRGGTDSRLLASIPQRLHRRGRRFAGRLDHVVDEPRLGRDVGVRELALVLADELTSRLAAGSSAFSISF